MRGLVLTLFCAWQLVPAMTQNITAKEADSVRHSLGARAADTGHINALVFLAEYLISKPGEEQPDLDSAAAYLAQARKLSTTIGNNTRLDYITLIESFLWKERGHRDTARRLCAEALVLAKTEEDKLLLGRVYYELAGYYEYDRTDELAQRLLLTDSAASAYREAGMLEREAFTLKGLAELRLNNDEPSRCLTACDTCLRIYATLHYGWVQPVYDLIGSAYYALGDYRRALSNGLRALQVSRDMHDSTMQLCEIEFNVGAIFQRIGDTAGAIAHLSAALNIAFLHHDQTNSYLVASELIRLYASSKTPEKGLRILHDLQANYVGSVSVTQKFTLARCYIYTYTALREFDKSQPYIDELLQLAKMPGLPPPTFCGIYLVVIKAYLAAGKYKAAGDCFPLFRDAVRTSPDAKFREYLYRFAFQLDTARRLYGPAIADLTELDRIRDSLSSADQANEIQQLNVAYETSEKEKHIQSLQSEKLLQERALGQSNQFRNFALVGVILSLLVIAVGYSRFRLKHEKNRQLEFKQQELEKEQEEVSRKNVELSRLLNENEWLLREVHHRVKNNLQIVKSLLDSQSALLKDESAQNAIRDSQHRVQAMALIHQKLYNSTDSSTIYMPDYINELIDYLKGSFDTQQRIYFRREIEITYLDVILAVPVGLILNEIITNAIKYAFPHTSEDRITIRLFQSGAEEITLIVADNGIGLPSGQDLPNSGSFGFKLINGLTEDLGGKVTIETGEGTTINLTFPVHSRNPPGSTGPNGRHYTKPTYEIA